jgi:hypothetical protein
VTVLVRLVRPRHRTPPTRGLARWLAGAGLAAVLGLFTSHNVYPLKLWAAHRRRQRGLIKEGLGAARPLRNCIVVGYAPFSP